MRGGRVRTVRMESHLQNIGQSETREFRQADGQLIAASGRRAVDDTRYRHGYHLLTLDDHLYRAAFPGLTLLKV